MVQPFDAPRDLGWDVLDPMFVVAYLEGWLLDSEARATLYDVHATLFGALATSGWGLGEEHLSLRPLLRRAFERQDLVVLAPRRRNAVLPGQPQVLPPLVPSLPPPPAVKTFIEIVLLDQDGKPVAGEAFRITMPDGTVQNGNLDRAGFARVDGIDPGVCDVQFPDIDRREWGKVVDLGVVRRNLGPDLALPSGAQGATAHVVKQGEDLFVIALIHGYRDWKTIYFDALNVGFRGLRQNPAVLFPGDIVNVPARQSKEEGAATGARHNFFVLGMRRKLILQLIDAFGAPFAREPYVFAVDGGNPRTGASTDKDGFLTEEIPVGARAGRVAVRLASWSLAIAGLNPMTSVPLPDDGISGAKGRLFNLGYDVGRIDQVLDNKTLHALRLFQAEHGLPTTGALDDATRAALARVHGS